MTSQYSENRSAETKRVAALKRYTPAGSTALHKLLELSSNVLDFPVAGVSIIGEDEVSLLLSSSTLVSTHRRQDWICTELLSGEDVLMIPDVLAHRRFAELRGVQQMGWRAYAGAAIQTLDRQRLGSVFVADTKPRSEFRQRDRGILRSLAQLAMNQLELGRIAEFCPSEATSPAVDERATMASILSLAQAAERWERMRIPGVVSAAF